MSRIFIIVTVLLSFLGRASGQVRLVPDVAQKMLIEKANPVYPALAKQARVQGTVNLEITVSEEGNVTEAKVLSGHPLLAGSALEAVKKSKYKPYSIDGKAVPFITIVEVPFSLRIPQDEYDRDQKLADRYFKQEDKCRGLLSLSKWQEAEESCKANLPIADEMDSHRGLEKVIAYEMVGYSVLGQNKHKDALAYSSRALEFGQARLKEDDADLGDLFVTIGLTHFRMGNLDMARDFYAKGEKALQLAYDHIGDSFLMERYKVRLERALEYHIRASEAAGDSEEVRTLKKRLASLP